MNLSKLLMFSMLCLAGCFARQISTDSDKHFNVFGIQLKSDVDYRVINNEPATEEPCLRGYERNFDRSGIIIGYGFDARIRRISTQNPATSLFGISPGITVGEGKRLAQQAGMREVSDRRYQLEEISLTLLVDDKGKVFGVTVEQRD